MTLHSHGASALRVRLSPQAGALEAYDDSGAPVASVGSVAVRPVDPAQLRAASGRRSLYGLRWPEAELAPASEASPAETLELSAEPGEEPLVAARRLLAEALERIQSWLASDPDPAARLAILTRGAVAAAEGEGPNPAQAALWGLLRSAQSEHPGRFLLIDSDDSEASQDALAAALAQEAEPQLALREGKALVPRLQRAEVEQGGDGQVAPIDPQRTILITGGSSGLGALLSRHLAAEHGARHLLLVSRRGPEAPGAEKLKAELEELGANATIAACDVSDRTQLAALIDSIGSEHPLGAVIHSAAVLDDGVLDSLDPERLANAFAPKAEAAWHLHELTRELDLSQFLLCSSVGGLLGSPAQANYAAANTFLDALACARRTEGLPATALAWGGLGDPDSELVAQLGEADLARLARLGFVGMPAEQILDLFDVARAGAEPLLAPVELNLRALRSRAGDGTLSPLLRAIVPVSARRGSDSLARRLASVPEAEREIVVTELVRSHAATVLGHSSAADIDPDRPFQELGFDSLGAVELRNRLAAATGLRLPPTLVFDYPTAAALARHLLAQVEPGAAEVRAIAAAGSDEPIAIVGMSCRLPGVDTPEALWRVLTEARDGIGGFPADRDWDLEGLFHPDPDNTGTTYTRNGGFVADATDFDADFFRISPREALVTDPQQRLLLESCWEALERSGVDPAGLPGSSTGVFAGVMYQDYGNATGGLPAGMTTSIVSGRVAYSLGLEGPAITVDTACSSSLVAMHLAAQALRAGECSLALAGGVTVLATPSPFVFFSHQRGLSPDGRCKSFAEAADGIGVSEGVGVVTLERLSDAQRNGHPVLATIRGSAVNQDGASNGLTAPNGPSQERVIRQALANARLAPHEVDAVEAHGTGTTLGDPIEAGALLATYGQDRDEPLYLGSVKSNIGHTQAAAGVAGVIKMVMALREGRLPKTLHVDAPSSKIEWEAGKVELLTAEREWAPNGNPRRAAVSSFGISGTNAHLILEEAPATEAAESEPSTGSDDDVEAPLHAFPPLLLSAKTEPALREQAARLAAHLRSHGDLDRRDVALSLTTTRTSFEHRAVVVGEGALSELDALARGEQAPGLLSGRAQRAERPVFLFGGQGGQHARMALALLEASPSFARHLGACEEALSPFVEWSLTEVLREEAGSWLERLDVVQPALFAVMVSLARLWEEMGVRPAAVVGHSQGEIAAAHIAGALSLPDAARVIALRAKAMTKLAGAGGMLSVALGREQVEARLDPYGERLSVAAVNGPASLVLSGEPAALAEFGDALAGEGVRTQDVAVDYAAHSAQIDDLEEELLAAFAPIAPQGTTVPFHSTVTGKALDTSALGAAYWYRNLRQPVLLEPVLRSLLEHGRRSFLEIGPHPVLSFGLRETIDAALADPEEAALLDTLRRDEGGPERFCISLAQAHAVGVAVDWERLFAGSRAKVVPLPTYPFQRKRYWLASGAGSSDPSSLGQTPTGHPLLSTAIEDPDGETLTLTGAISLSTHPWLVDHAVAGTVLLPGTAFVEMALVAGERSGCPTVEELTLQSPLILPERGTVQLQVSVGARDEEGERDISIHSRLAATAEEEPGEWSCHVEGALSLALPAPSESFAERGGDGHLVDVALPGDQAEGAGSFLVHPALLDEALGQALDREAADPDLVTLPALWRQVSVQAAGAASLRLHVRPGEGGEGVGLTAFDDAGAPLLTVGSVATRPFKRVALEGGRPLRLHRIEWRAEAVSNEEGVGTSVARLGEGEFAGLDGEGYADLGALVEALAAGTEPPAFAVVELSERIGSEDAGAAAAETAGGALELARAWISTAALAGSRLVFLTGGAVATRDGDDSDPATAAAWGLIRCAQAEHPDAFGLIDSDGSEASRRALPHALALLGDEPQLAIRGGTVLAPRLAPLPDPAVQATRDIAPGTTALVLGDLDGAGAIAARHLVAAHGCRHLLLADEGGEEGPREELRLELEGAGAAVRLAICDLSDGEGLRALLGSIPTEHPLDVVVHSVAAREHGVLVASDRARLDRAMRVKVESAWALHEATKHLDLSRFVLFSSAAGLLGGAGQSCPAAASAFLDALAAHRRASGLAATSLAWGLWTGTEVEDGSAEQAGRALDQMRTLFGFAPMPIERALGGLDLACSTAEPSLALIELDRGALRRRAEAGALPRVLTAIVPASRRRWQQAAGALEAQLVAAPPRERKGIVLELVRGHAAAVLGHGSAADVDPARAFRDLGFDSVGAVELGNRLNVATGLRLPPAVVFDHPSAAALAKHLLERIDGAPAAVAARPQRAAGGDEPIAIVGMSCRYPGAASSPELLWRLLAEGGDAIGEFPTDRGWDLERNHAGQGGFLDDVAEFDPAFFGIAPREAVAIDPQQRLMLEAAWEAFEDAGIDPQRLRESDTGVFAGAGASDYAFMLAAREPSALGSITAGNSPSVVAGRLSYAFGLQGPAVAIDTACSSSLVALHLACRSLQAGECSMALAGGVFVITNPLGFLDLASGTSTDGRCKAFDESADGTGFGEGVGIVLVERLSDAERLGHRVLATIRGSAVNQDGASNGLIAPNGPAQERVIHQALANSGLEPGDVDAVEAHGTGTALGDPIEAGALLATYGQERDRPVFLGSVKSNIGHTAAAAGVGGVIKMVLAMREGRLPKTLHVREPSKKIDWSAGKVELLTEPVAWPRSERTRRAAVSSFGMSGTNAHLILEEPPIASRPEGADEEDGAPLPAALAGVVPFVLSARNEPALCQSAARLRQRLDEQELDPDDVGFSLAATRASFERRAVVLGESAGGLRAGLSALASGAEDRRVVRGSARALDHCAFLYPGVGGQWNGMALAMREASPVFARALDECVEAFEPHLDWSLADVLCRTEEAPDRSRPSVGPVSLSLIAMMIALTEVWRSSGVTPTMLAGHSQGEVVAAYVAGGLSLEDAARVAAVRANALLELAGDGAMASVPLGVEEVEPLLEPWGGRIDVAALNGPSATVVSGDVDALEELLERCGVDGVDAKKIPAAVAASHSAQVERLRDGLLADLDGIMPRSGEIPFYSTVTGTLLDTANLGPEYWYENTRRTVRFEPVIRGLVEQGVRAFVEISPHPVLAVGVQATADLTTGDPHSTAVIGSLRRDDGGSDRFARSLAEAHVVGLNVDWARWFGGAEVVKLPTYAFQRQRYWPDGEPVSAAGDVTAAGVEVAEHPLLGAAVEGPGGEWIFTGRLSISTHPWLAERRVLDVASAAPAVLVELGLAVAAQLDADGITRLDVHAPLEFPDDTAVQLRVVVQERGEGGARRFEIHSRPMVAAQTAADWNQHADGILAGPAGGEAADASPPGSEAWPPEDAEVLDVDALYDELEYLGYHHDAGSRTLRRLWRQGSSLLAEVGLAQEQSNAASGYGIHPALLDCAAQIAILQGGEPWGGGEGPSQPLQWRGVRLHASGRAALRLRLDSTLDGIRLSASEPEGGAVLEVEAALPEPLGVAQLKAARQRRWLHRLEWRRVDRRRSDAVPFHLAVLGDEPVAGVDAVRYAGVAALSEACLDGEVPEVVVADLRRRVPGEAPEVARETCGLALELFQAWVASDALQTARLVLLTEGAVAVAEGDSPDLGAAPLWGMLRSALSEHPGRFAAIDLDGSEAACEALPDTLALTATEPQVALRAGLLLVPRLRPAALAVDRHSGPSIDPETTVLVTGGVTGIGAAVARHLVEAHGVRHLLLLSRRGPESPNAAELESGLRELGAGVTIAACDVADRDRLQEVLALVPAEHPLGAVIHSAAVVDNGVLESLDRNRLEAVLRPKVQGAWNLHELTREMELSQFVLFASAVGVLGHAAQVNYSAANVFLDSLAIYRRAGGLPGTCLDWGGWMPASDKLGNFSQADLARVRRLGVAPLTTELGLELFDVALESGASQLAPVGFDRAALREQAATGELAPTLRGLVPEPTAGPEVRVSLRERLSGVPESQRLRVVADLVREQIAAFLGYASAAEIGPEQLLQEMGFDSLAVVELRNQLAVATDIPIPILALTDNPTPDELARYLLEQVRGESPSGVNTPLSGEGRTALAPAAEDEPSLVHLLGRMLEDEDRVSTDGVERYMEILAAAADRRASFDAARPLRNLPRGARLADGPEPMTVVLLASAGPLSGPYDYVKLARSLGRSFGVIGFPLPGFVEGEQLPASVDALTGAYARAIEVEGLERPYVLAGHSSGGWIAHALAAHLNEIGAAPSAAILLDAYMPFSSGLRGILPAILRGAYEAAQESPTMATARLTAMAHYSGLFADWRPEADGFSTVVVEAEERETSLGASPTGEWDEIGACDLALTAPGNHFSMIDEHAASTARVIEGALADLIGGNRQMSSGTTSGGERKQRGIRERD